MTGQWSGHGRTSQNISAGTLAYRFLVRKCWVGKNGGLASLGSTWHLTHHFLVQWSPGLMCRLAKWPLSSVAENSCRRCVLIPRNSDHLEPFVSYHRSWLSSTESLQGFLLIQFHPHDTFFSAWCFTYSEMKQHGQLNLCHCYFSHEIGQWSFLFSMERGKKILYLFGEKCKCQSPHVTHSMSVSSESWWANSRWYKPTLTSLWFLFFLHSFSVVIHARLPLRDGCHPGTAGRWGCLPTHLSDSFSPRTGSERRAAGRQCCDSTGWLWFPVTCARGRRWPAGTHSIPQSFD